MPQTVIAMPLQCHNYITTSCSSYTTNPVTATLVHPVIAALQKIVTASSSHSFMSTLQNPIKVTLSYTVITTLRHPATATVQVTVIDARPRVWSAIFWFCRTDLSKLVHNLAFILKQPCFMIFKTSSRVNLLQLFHELFILIYPFILFFDAKHFILCALRIYSGVCWIPQILTKNLNSISAIICHHESILYIWVINILAAPVILWIPLEISFTKILQDF